MFLATSTFTILRGTSFDDFGDEIDTPTIVQEEVVGSVIERARTVFNPNDSRTTVTRELVGRFKPWVDVQDGDRLKDERTGTVYLVDAVHHNTSPIMRSDTVLDLRINTEGDVLA